MFKIISFDVFDVTRLHLKFDTLTSYDVKMDHHSPKNYHLEFNFSTFP